MLERNGYVDEPARRRFVGATFKVSKTRIQVATLWSIDLLFEWLITRSVMATLPMGSLYNSVQSAGIPIRFLALRKDDSCFVHFQPSEI
jgi:hypothetical protein